MVKQPIKSKEKKMLWFVSYVVDAIKKTWRNLNMKPTPTHKIVIQNKKNHWDSLIQQAEDMFYDSEDSELKPVT